MAHALARTSESQMTTRFSSRPIVANSHVYRQFIKGSDDRLEHRIDLPFFQRQSQRLRDDQSAIRRNIESHQTATESFMESGVSIIELSQRPHPMFVKQPVHEKRCLLDFVVSNCSRKDGLLTPTFHQPFDMLAVAVAKNLASEIVSEVPPARNENWLPRNHDFQLSLHHCFRRLGTDAFAEPQFSGCLVSNGNLVGPVDRWNRVRHPVSMYSCR